MSTIRCTAALAMAEISGSADSTLASSIFSISRERCCLSSAVSPSPIEVFPYPLVVIEEPENPRRRPTRVLLHHCDGAPSPDRHRLMACDRKTPAVMFL